MDRYEKALELARAYYDKDANAFLDTIFPELKENEDERIRKAMLQHFKNKTKEKWCNIPVKDIISWFEKQDHDGKKWITPAELNRLETLRYEAGFDDGVRSEMKKQEDHFRDDTKMVEQKPAEWSEEDKKKIHFLSRLIEFQVKDGEYCFGEGSCTICKQEAMEMLKSLRSSWKPSEEQIEALERCVEYLEESDNEDADILAGLCEHLKKLM